MNAQIKTNQNSNTSTIVAVALLIVSIVGVFVFLLPQKDNLAAQKSEVAAKQTELQSLKADIVRLENLRDSFEGSEVTMNDVLNLIPATVGESDVIKTIAELTTDNAVSLNSISFGQLEDPTLGVNTLKISTNISGGHQALISFLEDIESTSRKFIVDNISVQQLQDLLENMTLTIEAYYL